MPGDGAVMNTSVGLDFSAAAGRSALQDLEDRRVEDVAADHGEVGRGVTVFTGRGGKSGEPREILYCVVTRLEIGRVMRLVDRHDAEAFVVQHSLADVRGGIVRRPAAL